MKGFSSASASGYFYIDFDIQFHYKTRYRIDCPFIFNTDEDTFMVNRFGTTSAMVIQSVEENGNTVYLAIDAKGLYLTSKDRLDAYKADTNRYAVSRDTMKERITALGLDPASLFSENQHLIKIETEAQKRVNPLKASKRQMKK